MLIGKETNNRHEEYQYIKYLKKGDILKCKQTSYSLGDIGFSGMTFKYESFIKDKEYIVDQEYHDMAYVVDEDGTSCIAKPEDFDVVMEWDLLDLNTENIGLPSNMFFSFGTEINDMFYRMQYGKMYRWSIFKVCTTHYLIKQKKKWGSDNEWLEEWTKQMSSDLEEAKQYAMNDYENL